METFTNIYFHNVLNIVTSKVSSFYPLSGHLLYPGRADVCTLGRSDRSHTADRHLPSQEGQQIGNTNFL